MTGLLVAPTGGTTDLQERNSNQCAKEFFVFAKSLEMQIL